MEEFNKEALFVGFGGEFTYDGAILGTAERTVCDREVIVVDAKAPKAEVAKLLEHGAPRTGAKWVLDVKHHREQVTVIVYSQRLIVECGAQKFMDDGEYKTMDEAREASQEWHEFNTFTAWHGEHTPIFVDDWSNDE